MGHYGQEGGVIDFLHKEFAYDNPFGWEVGIGNVDDDDIHVPNAIEFQSMINDL